MTTVACAIISTANRWPLVREAILPRVVLDGFDEVVVAGDGEAGTGYRFLHIPAITGTTLDALVKRDAAAVATTSEYLWYLSDDHRPVPGALVALREFLLTHAVEALIPARMTWWEDETGLHRMDLNSGVQDGYCGGHSGVFSREAMRRVPWVTAPHDRLWDVYHSRQLQETGVRFHFAPAVQVEDVEHLLNPEAAPWR